MIIKVTKDFRCFKAGDTFDFSIIKEKYFNSVTIVGENGCGKSSLLHALRGYKNDRPTKSLYENDFKKLAENIEVEHDYDKIFYFDAVKDNGTDMMVAYDAVNFLDAGGLAKQRLSHGEGSLMYIARFVKDHEQHFVKSKTLLVFDEVDNGLSLKNQSIFVNFIYKMEQLGCHVLVISHNPFLIHLSGLCYDFAKKDMVRADDYIQRVTGYSIKRYVADKKEEKEEDEKS